MTISQALINARNKLINISDAPELDAQWLLQKLLRLDEVSWLLTHGETSLSTAQEQSFKQLLKRRSKGEPLAYILKEWQFYGRDFYVNNKVLVPRPSTEKLVETTLQEITDMSVDREITNNNPFVIADIGTGSGCIIITLALELANIQSLNIIFNFIAIDISKGALDIAKKNAKRHGLSNQIEFIEGDFLKPLEVYKVDLIVSNPPYVPLGELAKALQSPSPNTKAMAFEPNIALCGGMDGNDYINKLRECRIPAVVEGVGGKIEVLNKKTLVLYNQGCDFSTSMLNKPVSSALRSNARAGFI